MSKKSYYSVVWMMLQGEILKRSLAPTGVEALSFFPEELLEAEYIGVHRALWTKKEVFRVNGRILHVSIYYISFVLFFAAFSGWGGEATSAEELTLIEQQKLARALFNKIAVKDDYDVQGIEPLFLEVIERAPRVRRAEEAYWMLCNMYMQAFDPPRNKDAAALLEQYLARYPDSRVLDKKFSMFSTPGLPLVKERLLFLYEQEEMWEKAAALYDEVIPDPKTAGEALLSHFIGYGGAMEQTGQKEKAIAAYTVYLERSGNTGDFLEEIVKERLKKLGVEVSSDKSVADGTVQDDPGNLESLRGRNGEVFRFRVRGTALGEIRGDGVYTDDSSLAAAAVHAGVLRQKEEGVVAVRILPGRKEYVGAEKNGVVSESYGEWHGSYEFVETAGDS